MRGAGDPRLRIAVIGTGISGLSAAWLLAGSHDVTVYEADTRVGGHCNTLTVDAGDGNVAAAVAFRGCLPNGPIWCARGSGRCCATSSAFMPTRRATCR
ncbi:MAG: FAD-dependent oxidoreductase [Chloroflexi bacterium]|nr:FAD-dependent oxidoreductase [Chloroflexota bacterium]